LGGEIVDALAELILRGLASAAIVVVSGVRGGGASAGTGDGTTTGDSGLGGDEAEDGDGGEDDGVLHFVLLDGYNLIRDGRDVESLKAEVIIV